MRKLTVVLLVFVTCLTINVLPVRIRGKNVPIDAVLMKANKWRMPSSQSASKKDRLDKTSKRVELDMNVPLNQGESVKLWAANTIPYVIRTDYDHNALALIFDAMREWEKYTCVRFVLRNKQKNYVYIYNGHDCSSSVGQIGGQQNISLAISIGGHTTCLHKEIMIHELGHALGLHHEQSRRDRDKYVEIQWENIIDKMKYNFDINRRRTYGIRYDYTSIMHYGKNAFSKHTDSKVREQDDKLTMLTKCQKYKDKIGKSKELSFFDIMDMNFMYECARANGCPPRVCDCGKGVGYSFQGKDCTCWGMNAEPGRGRPVVIINCTEPETQPCN